MGWGTLGNVTTVHLDSSSGDPSQARDELYNALLELRAVIEGRNTANGVAGLTASGLLPATLLPNTLVSSSTADLTLDPDTGRVSIEDIINLEPKTTAELELVSATEGDVAYCSDGDAGTACVAVSLGETDSAGNSIWYRVALGTQIDISV